MRYWCYSFLGLATTLIVAFMEQSGLAFNIRPTQPGATRHYRNVTPYVTVDGLLGETWLDTYLPFYPDTGRDVSGGVSAIERGGTDGFLDLLKPFRDQGWNFTLASEDLIGSFEILHYYSCGTATNCAIEDYPIDYDRGGVGAHFHLKYRPVKGDPYGNKVHWIQRVLSSYTETGDPQPSDSLDIDPYQDTPYYDDGGDADTNYFIDTPYVDLPRLKHYFTAELYLVEQTATRRVGGKDVGDVTIYNGIRWGWKNKITGRRQSFSDSLASGLEVDRFNLPDLTPGSKYIAWTNNDLPSNRCNPNTFLSTHNNSGFRLGFDDNSSAVGNGFASALTGTVGSSGNINLDVRAAGGGARGQDRGNYELFVDVYDPQESPDFSVATSGGGGFGKEMRGLTQQNPILPNSIQNGWQVFNKVPGCRWFDPPTTYGFEFQSLEDTLFTEILDFPAGDDQQFTVAVGDSILGNFSPGDKLDFISLLGYPVDNFRITGIDSLFGETPETAFPIQLAFKEREGSFKMRQIPKPIDAEPVPEPGSILAANGMLLWFAGMRHILRKKRQAG